MQNPYGTFVKMSILTLVLVLSACKRESFITDQPTAGGGGGGGGETPPPSISCPTNFVPVPANSTLGTAAFCLSKYEQKVMTNAGVPVNDGFNGGVAYDMAQHKPDSRPEGTPWVRVSNLNAISECASLGSGYHLVKGIEWMAVARDVESVGSNWSSGTVGNGTLNRGHSDGAISGTAVADGYAVVGTFSISAGNGTDAYVATGNNSGQAWGAGREQKRTHTLSNGEVIWDLGGNVREHVDIDGAGSTISYTNPLPSNYYDANGTNVADTVNSMVLTNTAGAVSLNLFKSTDVSLNDTSNFIGMIYVSGGARVGRVMTRGANFSGGNFPGIYAADLDSANTDLSGSAGFRCAFSP